MRPFSFLFHYDLNLTNDAHIAAGWTTFLYIFKGSVLVGDNPIPQPTFHTVVLSNGSDETGVMIDAAEDDTQFILVRLRFLLHADQVAVLIVLLLSFRRSPGNRWTRP